VVNARAPLSRLKIVTVAIDMIDAHGLESFSIRSLGAELGVAPMTLYWHVGTKDELLALVLDELIGRVAVPEPGGHWTDRVAALLRDLRRVYLRHPQAAPLLSTRPATGPNALDRTEALVGELRSAGFDDAQVPLIYRTLLNYTTGSAQAECTATSSGTQPEGHSDAEGQSRSPDLAATHPHLAAILPGFTPSTPGESFEFGLARLLEALAPLADR